MENKHLLLSKSLLGILSVALLKDYFTVTHFRSAVLKHLEIVVIKFEVVLRVEGV